MKQRSVLRLLALGIAFTTTAAFAEAAPERTASQESSITVTEQRSALDTRIQADVINALARNESLSGKLGVVSHAQVVNLSGYLMTSGQVMRAGRTAASVNGVKYVVNEIRPRVGVVTY